MNFCHRFPAQIVGLVATFVLPALCPNPAGFAAESLPRTTNFNLDWKFIRDDVAGAEAAAFDDSAWTTVSCPHTWNDVDTFDDFAPGGHTGEMKLWTGAAWYRKSFTLPEQARGRRVFVEFQGVRQVAEAWINGKHLGRDTTGFIPFGFDLTPHLRADGPNVIALRVDNRFDLQFSGDMPWHHPNWHPPHGGIYRDVVLHVADPVHVTLPLFAHLETEGIYAWVESLTAERATVGVTAEIRNDRPAAADTTVTFAIVDREGRVVAESTERAPLAAGETRKVASRITVDGPRLWEPACPYVYQVRVTVAVEGSPRDVAVTPFGIRGFRFDPTTGFWINGHHLKLHGWGQKPTGEWAGLGAALPDWLIDHTLLLMREAGGNFLRWGHAAGPPAAATTADELGLVTMMPGVDGERDCAGIAWKTRADAFRDLVIFYRNHPSICIWEGGNYNVSPAHAAELRAIVDEWDPHGGRAFGFRMSTPDMRRHVTLDIGTIGRGRGLPSLPVVEGEYDRTEAPRRLWDKWSPPDFGRLGEHEEKNTYRVDSEGFATNAIREWWTKFGGDPAHCGGANWIFSDGTHGSRQVTDVARATGEVDAVRLPKEAYWALQSTWDDEPRVHLIGHWNYSEGTRKAMHAVAQADDVELLVNGRSHGRGTRSLDTLFTWTDVPFEPGEIKVVAMRGGKPVAEQVKRTAGPPAALRLTPLVAPGGWRADGADIALVDVEVVDADGRRCPTDQSRINFEVTGPGVWRGGYNGGRERSTNHFHFDTECGINRAAIRATRQAGEVTVTARREGLAPATLRLESLPVAAAGGLCEQLPARVPVALPPPTAVDEGALAEMIAARDALPPAIDRETRPADRLFSTFAYTGDGEGGEESSPAAGILAYTDDALLYIEALPECLTATRLIRTANADRGYWANDYIVATAGRDLDLFVAHDATAPRPEWLGEFRDTGSAVTVNGRPLSVFTRRLASGEVVRIPGNVDQRRQPGKAHNLILFAREADPTGPRP